MNGTPKGGQERWETGGGQWACAKGECTDSNAGRQKHGRGLKQAGVARY